MATRSFPLTHPDRVEEQVQLRADQDLNARDEVRWLMSNAMGRRIVWRLLTKGRVLGGPIFNSTATLQAGIAEVHDFVDEHLFEPIRKHAWDLLTQAKNENDRSTAERAPNTN